MNNIYILTIAIDFLALVVAVWLALYIVTRSPRNPVTWLTGLTLLSVAGWFLNVLLAVNPPSSPANLPGWLTPILWFWPAGQFQQGGGWMQGWQVTPAIFFWHHATTLMRPGEMNAWRWTRVVAGYIIGIAAVYVQTQTSLMFTSVEGNPLYLNAIKQGPLYPLFMGFLFIFTAMSIINLVRTSRVSSALMPRKQLTVLAVATVIAGLTGPTSFVAFLFHLQLPRVVLSILLAIAVTLMGYGVARYSAVMEGRVIGRDFIYNGVATLLVAVLYLAVAWISVVAYDVPVAALAVIVMLAIFTHSLVDVGRQFLDFIFYRSQARELRAKLRTLAERAGEPEALKENLAQALDALCMPVRATYGLILNFDAEQALQLASYQWKHEPLTLRPADATLDDVSEPPAGKFPVPLEEAALVIPLYSGLKQIGALILGRPQNAMRYTQNDIEHLLDLSDRIADVIHNMQRETEYLTRLAELSHVEEPGTREVEAIPAAVVEEALRNLHDFAYLGNSPIAGLGQVKARLPREAVTHLDRGREVHSVMLGALNKLRPLGEAPKEPIPREWYPYLILNDAYIKNVPNRDIMSRLYISEGTFNRARRTAIRSVARALEEMNVLD